MAGALIVQVAILLPIALILIALVFEICHVAHVKNQLQTAADAGAMAGAAKLRTLQGALSATSFSLDNSPHTQACASASEVVSANSAGHLGPAHDRMLTVSDNPTNDVAGDMVLGSYHSGLGFQPTLIEANAMAVTVRMEAESPNGTLPLIFGSLLGKETLNIRATAIAKVDRATLLPIVVYAGQWDALVAGQGTDLYRVDPQSQLVSLGTDGIREATVLPGDWDGADLPSGNFGWFDLGSSSTTSDLLRHVDRGPNEMEMATFGGTLHAGDLVSGITGFRSATEPAFVGGMGTNNQHYEGILGRPKIVALYDSASGNGTNAQFRICRFVLGRVVSVDLNGGGGGVVIQPINSADEFNRVTLVQ
jgi:Flp pilus assembly protein TadG